ncbi:hypothetical protein BHE74_00011863 [Ensete ventricosum]|nr:hypothetical protein BHE74_00011863 [Ensete ventricosum]
MIWTVDCNLEHRTVVCNREHLNLIVPRRASPSHLKHETHIIVAQEHYDAQISSVGETSGVFLPSSTVRPLLFRKR